MVLATLKPTEAYALAEAALIEAAISLALAFIAEF